MDHGNGSAQAQSAVDESGNQGDIIHVPDDERGFAAAGAAPVAAPSHLTTPAAVGPKAGARKKGTEKGAAKDAEKVASKESGDGGGGGGDGRRPSATLTAFTVQCAQCFKWRKIPTIELYEKIRSQVSQQPFTCQTTREWQPESPATCDSPPDLVQDGTLLWAMDRQDIPQPPPNWRRRIVVRGGTSNKFSDVYYHSPSGKVLRSMNDVEKFLSEHPEYVAQGVTPKHFSFASPRPLPGSPAAVRPKKAVGGSPAGATPPGSGGKRSLLGALPDGEQNAAKRHQGGADQEHPGPSMEGAPPGVPAGSVEGTPPGAGVGAAALPVPLAIESAPSHL